MQVNIRGRSFKGKRLDNGEWVEGKSVLYYGDGVFIYDGELKNNYGNGWMIPFGDCYEVEEETVCKSTEYKDDQGNKIFEGDIISDGDLNTGEVEFDYDSGLVFNTHHATLHVSQYANYVKIIGNIHD